MIKARVTNKLNGKAYLILGLTSDNIRRLEDDEPIGVLPVALGFDVVPDMIVIMRGDTEAEVAKQIEALEVTEMGLVFPKKKAKVSPISG